MATSFLPDCHPLPLGMLRLAFSHVAWDAPLPPTHQTKPTFSHPRVFRPEPMPRIEKKPEAQEAYEEEGVKKRNKRMFGALLGHLGTAQRLLKRDAAKIQNQARVQETVEQKNKESSVKLRKLQQELTQAAKEKALSQRDEVLVEMRKTERALLSANWEKRQRELAPFIVTKAQPPICWLPKDHNAATKALLAECVAALDRRIADRRAEDEEEFAAIEAQVRERAEARKARVAARGAGRDGEESNRSDPRRRGRGAEDEQDEDEEEEAGADGGSGEDDEDAEQGGRALRSRRAKPRGDDEGDDEDEDQDEDAGAAEKQQEKEEPQHEARADSEHDGKDGQEDPGLGTQAAADDEQTQAESSTGPAEEAGDEAERPADDAHDKEE